MTDSERFTDIPSSGTIRGQRLLAGGPPWRYLCICVACGVESKRLREEVEYGCTCLAGNVQPKVVAELSRRENAAYVAEAKRLRELADPNSTHTKRSRRGWSSPNREP